MKHFPGGLKTLMHLCPTLTQVMHAVLTWHLGLIYNAWLAMYVFNERWSYTGDGTYFQ